jgi:phage terminase large subunit GpA-like protein
MVRGRLHLSHLLRKFAAGYMHFPDDRDLDILTSYWPNGWFTKSRRPAFSVWEQIPGRANEALDCLVYSYAALCGLKHMGLKLNVRAANLEANPDKFLPAPTVPEEKISYELPGAVIEEPAPVKRKQISKLCRNKENHVQPEY